MFVPLLPREREGIRLSSLAPQSNPLPAMKPHPCLCFTNFLFLLTCSSLFTSQAYALRSPFHPQDLLPLLPRQVSWPLLNSLRSAVDLLPSFVGAASSSNRTLEWKGACFYENNAWMEFHNKSGGEFGGGTLHIKVSSIICTLSVFLIKFGVFGICSSYY